MTHLYVGKQNNNFLIQCSCLLISCDTCSSRLCDHITQFITRKSNKDLSGTNTSHCNATLYWELNCICLNVQHRVNTSYTSSYELAIYTEI